MNTQVLYTWTGMYLFAIDFKEWLKWEKFMARSKENKPKEG